MDSLEEKVKNIIAKKLKVEPYNVHLESSIADDLGADSLDIVELLMTMEDEFDLEIEEEEAQKLITVKDVLEYIKTNS